MANETLTIGIGPLSETIPTISRQRRLVYAVVLFIGFAIIYGFSRNHSYTYDAVVFANAVENPITQLPRTSTFEWNHFLWYPTGRAFYLLLHYFRISLRGYEALELLNALVGAAGIAITFLILSRLAMRPWVPLAWSVASGFCAVYWARSSGAENYLLGAFWAICLSYFLLSYWREPSDKHMVCMAVCAVLSAYYHLGNIAMIIATFAVVLIRKLHSGFVPQIIRLGLLFTLLWLPYAYIHEWFKPGGFSRWWLWSKGLADGYSPLQYPTGAFDWAFLKNATGTVQTFLRSVLWFESLSGVAIALLAILATIGTVITFYGPARKSESELPQYDSAVPFVFLIPFLSATALYAIWQPWNPIYWAVHTALFCLFAGAISIRRSGGGVSSLQATCFVLMIGLLAVQNLRAVILRDRVNPRQFVVDACLRIGQTIPRQSPVVISGRGQEWGYMKVYLPYFGNRRRFAIDLFLSNAIIQRRDPIVWMQEVTAGYLAQGIPVFIMDDVVSQKTGYPDFGVSAAQIRSVWPFEFQQVLQFPGNPPNKLYVVIPPAQPAPVISQ